MMPRAKLLVYMVVNGEFVYDEQVIHFEENLLNAVSYNQKNIRFGYYIELLYRYKLRHPSELPQGRISTLA